MSMEAENNIAGELTLADAPLKWMLNLNNMPDEGLRGELRANDDELRLLTQMLNDEHDLEVRFLSCSYEFRDEQNASSKKSDSKAGVEFRGHFRLNAELKQTCVITLERIDSLIDEEFTQLFSSRRQRPARNNDEADVIEDLFEEEAPLGIYKGKITIGPLVCQYLSMAIDANPRKEGALFEEKAGSADEENDKPASPFIVLEQYRQKK